MPCTRLTAFCCTAVTADVVGVTATVHIQGAARQRCSQLWRAEHRTEHCSAGSQSTGGEAALAKPSPASNSSSCVRMQRLQPLAAPASCFQRQRVSMALHMPSALLLCVVRHVLPCKGLTGWRSTSGNWALCPRQTSCTAPSLLKKT